MFLSWRFEFKHDSDHAILWQQSSEVAFWFTFMFCHGKWSERRESITNKSSLKRFRKYEETWKLLAKHKIFWSSLNLILGFIMRYTIEFCVKCYFKLKTWQLTQESAVHFFSWRSQKFELIRFKKLNMRFKYLINVGPVIQLLWGSWTPTTHPLTICAQQGGYVKIWPENYQPKPSMWMLYL